MIINKEVKIKMNSKHISKYRDLGYVCEVGELSIIKIEDLPKYSKCEIDVSCDICSSINKTIYINYTKLMEKFGMYRCFKCGKKQANSTMIIRYGVDNPTKCKEICKKISDKYHKKSDEEKNRMVIKQKETMFNKYGSWYTLIDSYKEKLKKYNLENYGVSDYRSTDEFKNKVKNTLMKNYGVENGIKKFLLKTIEKVTYAASTKVLPNSTGLKDTLLQLNLCRESKIKMHHTFH